MRKLFLTLTGISLLLCCSSYSVRAQQTRIAEREAEWNQYALPQTLFTRQVDPDNVVLFQVPSDWDKQAGEHLSFLGPHNSSLTVFAQKIPDGYPLRDYIFALIEPLRNLPDGADSLVIRRTTMSGVEAREIMFESDADTSEVTRRIIWSAVKGPDALSFVLLTPAAHAAEIEPYFKAMIQSVTFVDKLDYVGFAALRAHAIKDPKPARVDEVQALANSFSGLDGTTRAANISKLAGFFASTPDIAIDLLLDNRPMVRAAAYEALAASRNSLLDDFLLRALDERETFATEQAARVIAEKPNVIELLRERSLEWFRITPVGRVWPFLSKIVQQKILQEIFAQTLLPAPPADLKAAPAKPHVTVSATVLAPGLPPPPVNPSQPRTTDPTRYFNGLLLLDASAAIDFKVPFTKILGAKNEALTVLALQIAWRRDEKLPGTELLKILNAYSDEVQRLSVLHLGRSGSVADIKTIQGFFPQLADPKKTGGDATSALINQQIETAISRIRFREEMSAALPETKQQLIVKGLADPLNAEWVWYNYVRVPLNDSRQSSHSATRPLKILPLGENLFPKDVTYFAALPEPVVTLDKLSSALQGLQMESARSQANLVLMMSSFREHLLQQLDSPADAAPTSYSGINLSQPIATARWSAPGAPNAIERKAIILRVTDRSRFERTLTLYQQSIGGFKQLPEVFSVGVRFLTVLPGLLPLGAKALFDTGVQPTKEPPLVRYDVIGGTEWNGYPIKIIEKRSIAKSGHITSDAAYLTYVGDTAILAPDLESLTDMLQRAASEQPTLADNPNFKRMKETRGESVYLSNFIQLFAQETGSQTLPNTQTAELGALNLSNSTWENVYHIQFPEHDWIKPFVAFQPQELASPRELLPRSTVAYYFMKIDAAAGWRDWMRPVFSAAELKEWTSAWAIDFEKDVLPELGPECGVAVLGLPAYKGDALNLPWAAFFKLKSDKLSQAIEVGKLLNGGAATSGPLQIKLKTGNVFVQAKHGFLVISDQPGWLELLDQKEKLATSRDFERAAKQAPAGVVAFGGYNLEAAIAAVGDPGGDSIKTAQLSMISSITNAFHSPNFYATATAGAVDARFSLSMGREGRFSVSELSSLAKDYRLTYAIVETRGVPIQDQARLSSLKLRMHGKAAGEIERIKHDLGSAYQTVNTATDNDMVVTILPRHSEPKTSLPLPIKGVEFAAYLKPDQEIRSDDASVIEKARTIVGEEHDSWKVARMLADWTFTNLKWKRVDSATASQTLATLEADCLEFSQLYVAMARSLGLPARVVSGMAHSGSSFGGHAWVEVYVGEWLEVDPTWGTAFVDATHIRDSGNGELLTYASLNLLDIEVLDAPHAVADFQKDARALAQKLSEELPHGNAQALSYALDLPVLTRETTSLGNWDSLSDLERDLMSSAYRRALADIVSGFSQLDPKTGALQLLKVRETGDRAEAVLLNRGLESMLVRFTLARTNGVWSLLEVHQIDSGLNAVSEIFQPTVKNILERRSNKSTGRRNTSEFVRVLLTMQKDRQAALVMANRALQEDPENKDLINLKALILIGDEKPDEAIKLWREIASGPKPYVPALLNLAQHYDSEDAAEQKLAVEFYQQYRAVEADDPRTATALASLYERLGDEAHAETEYRAALKSDPTNGDLPVDLATFLVGRKRIPEALAVIDAATKATGTDEDLFGELMAQLYSGDEDAIVKQLGLSEPQRTAHSAKGTLYLAFKLMDDGQNLKAITLLKRVATMKADWVAAPNAMAQAYRALHNWSAALSSALAAIKIDPENSDSYFNKACALARLGRTREALTALAKAVDLDPDLTERIVAEADLKSLAAQPAFQKLIKP